MYILRKLLTLDLWPGSLWAAVSNAPSEYATSQPGSLIPYPSCIVADGEKSLDVDPTLPASKLVADVVKRSRKAHLFHFYGSLCKIAALPRKTPSAWIHSSEENDTAAMAHSTLPFKWEWDDDLTLSSIVHAASTISLEEYDARTLASSCLREIGRELGVL